MRLLSLLSSFLRRFAVVCTITYLWSVVPQLSAGTPPFISVAPQSTNLTVGQYPVFSVDAGGTPPLSYQWIFNGTNLLWANTNSITITNASYQNVGTYSVVVSNPFGVATSPTAIVGLVSVPISTNGPLPTEVYLTRNASFSVGVYSLSPVGYQWYFGSTLLPGQTNAELDLTGLTNGNAGSYYVYMTNAVGASSSVSALLTIDPWPAPQIRLGDPAVTSSNLAFPVIYLANGAETNFSFSLRYDPAFLTNAEFQLDNIQVSNNISVAYLSNAIGASITLPTNSVVYPGETNLGTVIFQAVPGATNLFAGRIEFADQPLPLQLLPLLTNYNTIVTNTTYTYVRTNGHTIATPQITYVTNNYITPEAAPPVLTGNATTPGLNFANGLIEQSIEIANPGSGLVDNLFLLVAYNGTLGTIAQTNLITLYNATGTLVPSGWFINEGTIAPGEHRWLLLQYFSSDRVTIPNPTLEIAGTGVILTNGPAGSLTLVGNPNLATQGLTLQFPTQTNFHYYVQYAPSASGLTNTAQIQTVVPSFLGTGNPILWTDSIAPNTTNGVRQKARIYRVIETQ